ERRGARVRIGVRAGRQIASAPAHAAAGAPTGTATAAAAVALPEEQLKGAVGNAGILLGIRRRASRGSASRRGPAYSWEQPEPAPTFVAAVIPRRRLGQRRALVAEELQCAAIGNGDDLVAEIADLDRACIRFARRRRLPDSLAIRAQIVTV